MAALPLRSVGAPRRVRPGSPRSAPQVRPSGHVPRRSRSETTELRLVPRRRRAAGLVVFFAVVAVALMLGAAVFHTQLSERQLEIDRLEQQVSEANARFEVLRGQRAELRSPGRLWAEAYRLGMHPAPSSDFVAVDKWALARTIASVGIIDDSRHGIVGEGSARPVPHREGSGVGHAMTSHPLHDPRKRHHGPTRGRGHHAAREPRPPMARRGQAEGEPSPEARQGRRQRGRTDDGGARRPSAEHSSGTVAAFVQRAAAPGALRAEASIADRQIVTAGEEASRPAAR